MLLSEHVYCVAVTFKMTAWVEQQIYRKFCIKLEHASAETLLQMIHKATAIGTWWLAASPQQRRLSCIVPRAVLFGETSIDPHDSATLQPRFGTLWFLTFPKLKSPLKGKRFQTVDEMQGNTWAAGGDWENCVGIQGAYFEGHWGIILLHTCFLYLVSSSMNVSIFHRTWLDTFWTGLVYRFICMHIYRSIYTYSTLIYSSTFYWGLTKCVQDGAKVGL